MCDFGHAKSSEAYWMIFDYQSGSCKSSEAYWMVYDHRSGSGNSGESYREGFVPTKVEVAGLFFGAALFILEASMKQERLSVYTVNLKYIRNLHNADDNVFSISPQVGKANRPFVGIIVICDDKQYCVPLSSPKEKHKEMKNDVDFSKVFDSKGKLIGVLDFNNMIPVREDVVRKIEVTVHPQDSAEMKHYKNLLMDQLTFCRQNQEAIVTKANKLYRMVTKKNASDFLKRRCLQFKKLEEVLDRFKP